MARKLQLFICLIFGVLVTSGQNNFCENDSVHFFSESKIARLCADTAFLPFKHNPDVLKSKNFRSKSAFLSTFNTSLKSGNSETAEWKLDSVVFSDWNEDTKNVVPMFRILLNTMDVNPKFELRYYKMDDRYNHWIIHEAQLYNYTDGGQLDSVEYQTHVTLNYILYTRFAYTYKNGRLHAEESKEKFDIFDEWEWLNRYEYEYDSLGNLARVYTQMWDDFSNNHWSTYEFVEYKYDSLSRLISETYFEYDDYEMLASKTSELHYFYNGNNQLETIVEYIESWQEGVFLPEAKQENTFDDLGRLTQRTLSKWEYDLEDWVGFMRHTQQFDTGENTLLTLTSEYWDEQWMMRDSVVYETVNRINPDDIKGSEFILAFIPVYTQDGLLADKVSNFYKDGNEWQARGGTSFSFSKAWPLTISETNQPSVKIYPNPVVHQFLIEIDSGDDTECIVRDLYGSVLIHKTVKLHDRIDVSDFTSGVYVVELRQEKQRIYATKFIKK